VAADANNRIPTVICETNPSVAISALKVPGVTDRRFDIKTTTNNIGEVFRASERRFNGQRLECVEPKRRHRVAMPDLRQRSRELFWNMTETLSHALSVFCRESVCASGDVLAAYAACGNYRTNFGLWHLRSCT
jgi:hypothetical protein